MRKASWSDFVPIVSDGAISNPDMGEGRLVPLLLLDCSSHADLRNVISIRAEQPGDVVVTWGWRRFHKAHVYLTIEFKSPVATTANFEFNVERQGNLVHLIRKAKGVYLQSADNGDRVAGNLGNPMRLVEIPPTASFPVWDSLFERALRKRYRGAGMSKGDASKAVADHIARIDELFVNPRRT